MKFCFMFIFICSSNVKANQKTQPNNWLQSDNGPINSAIQVYFSNCLRDDINAVNIEKTEEKTTKHIDKIRSEQSKNFEVNTSGINKEDKIEIKTNFMNLKQSSFYLNVADFAEFSMRSMFKDSEYFSAEKIAEVEKNLLEKDLKEEQKKDNKMLIEASYSMIVFLSVLFFFESTEDKYLIHKDDFLMRNILKSIMNSMDKTFKLTEDQKESIKQNLLTLLIKNHKNLKNCKDFKGMTFSNFQTVLSNLKKTPNTEFISLFGSINVNFQKKSIENTNKKKSDNTTLTAGIASAAGSVMIVGGNNKTNNEQTENEKLSINNEETEVINAAKQKTTENIKATESFLNPTDPTI